MTSTPRRRPAARCRPAPQRPPVDRGSGRPGHRRPGCSRRSGNPSGQAGGAGALQVGGEHRVDEVVVLRRLQEDEVVAGVADPPEVDVPVVVADIDAADEGCVSLLRRGRRHCAGSSVGAGVGWSVGSAWATRTPVAARKTVGPRQRQLTEMGRAGATVRASASVRHWAARVGRRASEAPGTGLCPFRSQRRDPWPAPKQGRSVGGQARGSSSIASAWASATTRGMVMVTRREYRRRRIRAGAGPGSQVARGRVGRRSARGLPGGVGPPPTARPTW